MKSIVVIQARTNSSRLPGKVLLPIHGMPIAVLAAKRAGNTGRHVIVATSQEATDDALVELLNTHGIPHYRGSLDNALQRIVDALIDYDDDILVFRLTADNVFPDGQLLDEIEKDFIARGVEYICCNGEPSGLPYGMSAELTRLRHLRQAAVLTTDKFDQEHVTPFVRRRYGEEYFHRYRLLNRGHLRCTIDCLDDYLSVQRAFSSVDDPVRVAALELMSRLEGSAYQPLRPTPARKLVLGTAQLGLAYGIANRIGKVDPISAKKLIKTAISSGVEYLDTARVYGGSEEIIGATISTGWEGRAQIITKLSPLDGCPPDAGLAVVNAFVDASFYASCAALRVQALNVVLLHRAEHIHKWRGAVWSRLKFLQAKRCIRSLGVSIQTPLELESCLEIPEIEFIQMPFNVLDWRWDGLIEKIKTRKLQRHLVIHARSALLQGLLPSMNDQLWRRAGVVDGAPVIRWLWEQCRLSGRESVADFCLAYVMSMDWIDGVVVGMESSQQLEENIGTFAGPLLSEEQIVTISSTRPRVSESVLNPVQWGRG